MVSSLDQFRNSSGRNYTITPNQQLQGLLWFHLFGFLWANNVINGIWCCTVAGAMCRWYWMFQEDKDHKEFEKFITWVRRQRAPARVRGACSWPPAAPAPTRKRTLIHPPPAPNPNTRGCSCDAPARCHHMPAPEAHRNVDHAPRTNTGGLMPRLVASREQLQPVR